MADSIRKQIMTAFVNRMKTITVAGGYETDIGLNVGEWRTEDFQAADIEGMDVRDTGEATEVIGGNHLSTISIEIESKVSGGTSPDMARKVVADISKAIGTDRGFGGLVQRALPAQNESLGFDRKDRMFGSILMSISLSYITKPFKPYDLA